MAEERWMTPAPVAAKYLPEQFAFALSVLAILAAPFFLAWVVVPRDPQIPTLQAPGDPRWHRPFRTVPRPR